MIKNQPSDFYDIYGQENPNDAWMYLRREPDIVENLPDITFHEHNDVSWLRREVKGTTIETSLVMNLDVPIVNNEVDDEDEEEEEDNEDDDDV